MNDWTIVIVSAGGGGLLAGIIYGVVKLLRREKERNGE